MTPENIARYKWLDSQLAWHSEKKGPWHAYQRWWFNREIQRLPGVVTYIIGEVIREHSAQIVDNVTKNNALFQRLTRDRIQS